MANAGASFITFLDCSEIYEKILKDKESHPEFYEGDYNIIQLEGPGSSNPEDPEAIRDVEADQD